VTRPHLIPSRQGSGGAFPRPQPPKIRRRSHGQSTRPDNLTGSGKFHNSGYMEDEEAILALAALAQPTRLQAFRLLVRHEPEGLAAGDLARLLEVPANTLSAHLSVLSRADLVTSERYSRSIVYRANLAEFRDVALFLLRDCCGGRPEVCAPVVDSLRPCCPPKRKERSRV
jgi:ArsR family transcriptional regulator, arsenate/arsenite/antimonite-responsive transcriptional repressor